MRNVSIGTIIGVRLNNTPIFILNLSHLTTVGMSFFNHISCFVLHPSQLYWSAPPCFLYTLLVHHLYEFKENISLCNTPYSLPQALHCRLYSFPSFTTPFLHPPPGSIRRSFSPLKCHYALFNPKFSQLCSQTGNL